MKKILKNAYLFIIAIAVLFSFNIDAFAACNGAEGCRDTENRTIYVSGQDVGSGKVYMSLGSSGNTYTSKYKRTDFSDNVPGYSASSYYTSISGLKYYKNGSFMAGGIWTGYKDNYSSLWCLDGNLPGDSNTLYASRFLNDPQYGKRINTFDYAVTHIMLSGSGYSTSLGRVEYWEKLMAIRALATVFGYDKRPTGSNDVIEMYSSSRYALYSTVYNWITGNSSSAYNKVNSLVGLLPASNFSAYLRSNYFTDSGNTLATAQSLFNEALEAAATFAENYEGGSVDTSATPEVITDPIKEENTVNGIVTAEIKHTIVVPALAKDQDYKFTIDGVTLNEDKTYDGIESIAITTIEVQNGNIYSTPGEISNILGKNLVELGWLNENEETTIEITVTIKGYKEAVNGVKEILKCGQQPVEYHIDGTYKGPGEWAYSDYVVTIWYISDNNEQRYVGIEPASEEDKQNVDTDWTSSYSISLIPACDCTTLEDACIASGNPNSSECQELKESNCGDCSYLEAVCEIDPNSSECDQKTLDDVCNASCDTTFTEYICCDENDNLILSTSTEEKEETILGPENVATCFVTKANEQNNRTGSGKAYEQTGYEGANGIKDQEGNVYTLAEMKNNRYCTVSCKEDYIMTMPTAKLVNAGRYFTFKAKVDGTKTCYTNSIDIDGYNDDIEDLIADMEEAFNEYNKYKTAIEEYPGKVNTERYQEFYGTNCGNKCSYNYLIGWNGETIDYETYVFNVISDSSGILKTVQVSKGVTKTYDYMDEGMNDGGYSNDCPASGRKCGCCGKDCDPCQTEYSAVGDAQAGDFDANVKPKLENRLKYWKERYEYLEDLLYQYQEMFADCTYSWTSEMHYEPDIYYDYEEDEYMSKYNHIGEMDQDVSYPTTDDICYYAKGDITNNVYGDEGCSGSTGYKPTTVRYVTCTTNGKLPNVGSSVSCTESAPIELSTSQYVKRTSTVEANYKPATLFYNVYPSGDIVTREADDNVALENKLPVALNRNRGIYEYTINITNLGEFYHITSSNDLGRYAGSGTAVVDKDKIVYACDYLVNMGYLETGDVICESKCSGPDCDAYCIGPNCQPYCDGIDCVANCIGVGCIYDEDAGTSITQRVISVNSLFPNGVEPDNWKRSSAKAKATIEEIEGAGNTIYDDVPILSVTIDPSTARQIRAYNDSLEDSGSYSAGELNCYKLGSYEEVACYSGFIDALLDGEYGDNVVNEDNSKIADQHYRTGTDVAGNTGEYFEKWTGSISEDNKIGPAWK